MSRRPPAHRRSGRYRDRGRPGIDAVQARRRSRPVGVRRPPANRCASLDPARSARPVRSLCRQLFVERLVDVGIDPLTGWTQPPRRRRCCAPRRSPGSLIWSLAFHRRYRFPQRPIARHGAALNGMSAHAYRCGPALGDQPLAEIVVIVGVVGEDADHSVPGLVPGR